MVERESGKPVADVDPLLTEIEAALAASGTSATRFGYLAAGDPSLLPKMRGGRRIKKASLRNDIVKELEKLRAEAARRALD